MTNPKHTDTVQPKVRLRKALHHRLTDAASANRATLNGEIVRRLEESFLHEALERRLSTSDPPSNIDRVLITAFEERLRQTGISVERLTKLLERGVVVSSLPDGTLTLVTGEKGSRGVIEVARTRRKISTKGG